MELRSDTRASAWSSRRPERIPGGRWQSFAEADFHPILCLLETTQVTALEAHTAAQTRRGAHRAAPNCFLDRVQRDALDKVVLATFELAEHSEEAFRVVAAVPPSMFRGDKSI